MLPCGSEAERRGVEPLGRKAGEMGVTGLGCCRGAIPGRFVLGVEGVSKAPGIEPYRDEVSERGWGSTYCIGFGGEILLGVISFDGRL